MQNASGFALMGGNFNLGKPGLTAGTTTTYTIATAFTYTLGGKSFSKGSGSNAASPTTDAVTGAAFRAVAANQACVFVFCVDSGGTVKVVQGGIVDNREISASGGSVGAPIPNLPDTLCPFGYLLLQAGPTASNWTFGSSNTSGATGITYTWQDVMSLPTQPITA